ncbi:hypothetical protein CFP56_042080 [Quercus suber]
MLNFCS